MLKKNKGIAPIIIVLIVALGLIGGTAVGYEFREPIKKAIQGKTSSDEIKEAVNKAKEELELGKKKFELEGVTTSVDASAKSITVKIKSSTNSIKEMRLSEAPITVSDTAEINSGSTKDLKIVDIPINAQVHVGGTIKSGLLAATKVIIQKEDADESSQAEKTHFALGGTVKEVKSDSIVVTVSTANKLAKDQKGKDLTIKVNSSTVVEKGDSAIALSDVKADDSVQVNGVIENTEYIASKIEVKVKEQAGELEETQTQNSGSEKNIETQNQEKNTEPASSNSSGGNSNSNKNQ